MKNLIKKYIIPFLIGALIALSFFSYSLYKKSKITPQCERAYNNYMDYMKEVNKIALDNGFGPQSTVSLYEFCKN